MSSSYWQNTVILGKGLWYDVNSCLMLSPRFPKFVQLNQGCLSPLSNEEARKVSYVARFLLAKHSLSNPFIGSWALGSYAEPIIFFLHGLPFCGLFRGIATFFCDKVTARVWGGAGFVLGLIYSISISAIRSINTPREIASTPNNLIEGPDDRKPIRKEIAANPDITAPGVFSTLPTELHVRIFSYLGAENEGMHVFSLSCKWATKICWHADLRHLHHLERVAKALPKTLFRLMRNGLKEDYFGNMSRMRCMDNMEREAQDVPPSSDYDSKFPPGSICYLRMFLKNHVPAHLPVINSDLSTCAPFITINPDWLGNQKSFQTLTPAKTQAFIFVYKSNYTLPESSSCFFNKDHHIVILTQPSPLNANEWWLVQQCWSGSTEAYMKAYSNLGANPPNFKDSVLTHKYTRIVFDETGEALPECQGALTWFSKFLAGQEVGFLWGQGLEIRPSDPVTNKVYTLQFTKT